MVLLKIKLKSLLSQRGCQKLCDADFLIYNMKIIQKEFPLALLDCSLGVTLKLSNKLKGLWGGWKQFQYLFYFTVSTLPHPVVMSQCTPTSWSFTFSITPPRWVHLNVKVNKNKSCSRCLLDLDFQETNKRNHAFHLLENSKALFKLYSV